MPGNLNKSGFTKEKKSLITKIAINNANSGYLTSSQRYKIKNNKTKGK